jgi:hypothetical protein
MTTVLMACLVVCTTRRSQLATRDSSLTRIVLFPQPTAKSTRPQYTSSQP